MKGEGGITDIMEDSPKVLLEHGALCKALPGRTTNQNIIKNSRQTTDISDYFFIILLKILNNRLIAILNTSGFFWYWNYFIF